MSLTVDRTLHELLLDWFDRHQRDLPWRRTRDPYAIWVSEVMLQQTQVATVVEYWLRWMARFPTVEALAAADEQEALALWQGLGYYRRCKLLLAGARHVVEFGWPRSAEEWLKVPGVGRYTAAAIASIASEEPAALVDGNVERVYARLSHDNSSGVELHAKAWQWASASIHHSRPGAWNQALMELGATVCRPVAPLCESCPVAVLCRAREAGVQNELPKRDSKPSVVQLRHTILVPHLGGTFGVRLTPPGPWWQGLWEFPRSADVCDLEALVDPAMLRPAGTFRHSVTNHRITVEVSLAECPTRTPALRWCSKEELAALPMPSPQRRAMQMALQLLARA